jgi:chromosomal replication initiator protein
MTIDSQTVWDNCLHTIRKSVNAQSFKTWFEPIRPIHLDQHTLTISVPNKFFYEWLEEHYVHLLKTSVRRELGDKGRLLYHIPEGSKPVINALTATKTVMTKTGAANDDHPAPGSFDAESIKNPFIIPGIKRIRIEPQLNTHYTFENFIEGDCNKLARNAALAIARNPGKTAFNPLFLFGAVGLGKTHLAQAIGNEIVQRFADKAVLYVSAEKFTTQIIQAIKNNAINDFVNWYQMVDVLILDDIQFIGGKQKTQEIFFHLFNQLHQNGKQIVLTCDRAPKDLEGVEDRLISRFKWGLSADLQTPDLETRMAILDSKMNVEGVDIPPNVLEFICYNVKNNIRELEGVMVSLLAQATLIRRDIDMDLAKEVIRNFVSTIHREITAESIQHLVAEQFNVPVAKLLQDSRKRNIVIARQLSMFLTKKMTNKSLKTIGEIFGGRDHSTVIYSCRAVQDMIDTDLVFKDTVEEVEKKIRMSVNN